MVPDLPLKPVFTRQVIWPHTATFHTDHYEVSKNVIAYFDPNCCFGVKKSQEMFTKNCVKIQLSDIKLKFDVIVKSINMLEDQMLFLYETICIHDFVKHQIINLDDTTGNKFYEVLNQNEEITLLWSINNSINGSFDEIFDINS